MCADRAARSGRSTGIGAPGVLCIGQIVADVVAMPLRSLDLREDTTSVASLEVTNGGDAFNTAIVLARLGVRTALCGQVGADPFGEMLLGIARSDGVEIDRVMVSEIDRTSVCIVLIDTAGERVFVYYGGANATFGRGGVDLSGLDGIGIMHFGGVYNLPALEGECMTELLSQARERGIVTSMDVTWDSRGRWLETIDTALPHLDYFLPSMNEARMICGTAKPEKAADFLLARGVRRVCIKLGPEGCLIADGDGRERVAGFAVKKVVDTTGAGDSFVAGFLAGYVRGWSFRECARMGNAAGALAVQNVGATAGVRSLEEVYSLYRSQGRE